MERKLFKPIFFAIFLLCSHSVSAAYPWNLFFAFSGGFGEVENDYENTGQSGIIRIAFGSLMSLNSKFAFGEQIGFQTSTQYRLNTGISSSLNADPVPVFESNKTPIDFLLIGRYELFKPLFFEARAGAVFMSATASGADIQTRAQWLPEVQIGIGSSVYGHTRLSLSYQQFFGTMPVISPVNVETGIFMINGYPTWRAAVLTFEHDL